MHNQPRTEPPPHDPPHIRIRRQRRQQRPDGDTAPPPTPFLPLLSGVQTGEDPAHGPLALGRQGQTTGVLLLLLLQWLLFDFRLQTVVEEKGGRPPVGLRGRQGVAEL